MQKYVGNGTQIDRARRQNFTNEKINGLSVLGYRDNAGVDVDIAKTRSVRDFMSYDVIDVLSVHQQRQFVEASRCSSEDKTRRLTAHER